MLLDYFWKRQPIRAGGGWLRTNGEAKPSVNDIVRKAMSCVYDEVKQNPKLAKKAAKVVRPFVEKTVKHESVPPTSSIDWKALERDALKVAALLKLLEELEFEDEELCLMMMAH